MEPEPTSLAPVVCVVDDDESIRRALRRLIGSLGMRVETFATPEEFLARVLDGRISCLLLDVHLPGMDGFELCERTLKAGLDSPVIFITAQPDHRTRQRARDIDAVAYLEKPFDDETLSAALEEALGRIAHRTRTGPGPPSE